MEAINYTQARKNFATVMNHVCEDHSPIIITRQNQDPVVLISLADYNAIEETLYLLKGAKNAARLRSSVESAERGDWAQRDLL